MVDFDLKEHVVCINFKTDATIFLSLMRATLFGLVGDLGSAKESMEDKL